MTRLDTPHGLYNESSVEKLAGSKVRQSGRVNKNQGPKRFGDLIKSVVKIDSTDAEIADPKYHLNLAKFKTQTVMSTETGLKLVERNVFRRNFGYAALDMTRTWKAAWKVRLDIN